MQPHYIGCDVAPWYNSQYDFYACTGTYQIYSEQQVIDLYATSQTSQMDNEDFQIVGTFATYCLLVAVGVKFIRKIMGV